MIVRAAGLRYALLIRNSSQVVPCLYPNAHESIPRLRLVVQGEILHLCLDLPRSGCGDCVGKPSK